MDCNNYVLEFGWNVCCFCGDDPFCGSVNSCPTERQRDELLVWSSLPSWTVIHSDKYVQTDTNTKQMPFLKETLPSAKHFCSFQPFFFICFSSWNHKGTFWSILFEGKKRAACDCTFYGATFFLNPARCLGPRRPSLARHWPTGWSWSQNKPMSHASPEKKKKPLLNVKSRLCNSSVTWRDWGPVAKGVGPFEAGVYFIAPFNISPKKRAIKKACLCA